MTAFSWKMATKRAIASMKVRVNLDLQNGRTEHAEVIKRRIKRLQDAST